MSLFNGKDLAGWVVDGGDENAGQAKGGELVVNAAEEDGQGVLRQGYLLTERGFADVHLRSQFQANSHTAVGGIALRAVPNEASRNWNPHDRDWPFHLTVFLGKRRENDPSGTLWWPSNSHVQPPLFPEHPATLKPIGEWNDVEIEKSKCGANPYGSS